MRLSSNPNQPLARSGVRPWHPPTLVADASPAQMEKFAEQVLSIFTSTSMRDSCNQQRVHGHCQQAKIQAWIPANLMESPALDSWPNNISEEEGAEHSASSEAVALPVELEAIQAQAAALLAEAQAQAEALLQQAREEAEQFRQQAYLAGRAEGEAELRGLIETLKTIVQEVQVWRERLFSQSEPLVLEMVAAIARALFTDGFTLDADTLQQTYSRVLEHTQTLGDLRIYVNPEDARMLDPYWKEAQVTLRDQQIKLIPSDAIRRGGCYVEGQYGAVDGRIEVRLERLLSSLLPETVGGGRNL
ncbi:FliH/SctL family protein [uncultured Thermanaerothrix sp.]|uniref:FliH/SctL family protein n=1 Tax=uncultured Thermanaerothrix sp. TaxID=1195149 RepID=UPI00261BDD40|nr:FliH/SctL family protein [uncultured Thermanaerothrix sp.]